MDIRLGEAPPRTEPRIRLLMSPFRGANRPLSHLALLFSAVAVSVAIAVAVAMAMAVYQRDFYRGP